MGLRRTTARVNQLTAPAVACTVGLEAAAAAAAVVVPSNTPPAAPPGTSRVSTGNLQFQKEFQYGPTKLNRHLKRAINIHRRGPTVVHRLVARLPRLVPMRLPRAEVDFDRLLAAVRVREVRFLPLPVFPTGFNFEGNLG
jgi:hypothetical protein